MEILTIFMMRSSALVQSTVELTLLGGHWSLCAGADKSPLEFKSLKQAAEGSWCFSFFQLLLGLAEILLSVCHSVMTQCHTLSVSPKMESFWIELRCMALSCNCLDVCNKECDQMWAGIVAGSCLLFWVVLHHYGVVFKSKGVPLFHSGSWKLDVCSRGAPHTRTPTYSIPMHRADELQQK